MSEEAPPPVSALRVKSRQDYRRALHRTAPESKIFGKDESPHPVTRVGALALNLKGACRCLPLPSRFY